jgi:hypothetical protein
MQAGSVRDLVQVNVACGRMPAKSQTASHWVIEKFEENARRADLDVVLTYDGADGERSGLCDLRPAVMAARVRRCGGVACQRPSCGC